MATAQYGKTYGRRATTVQDVASRIQHTIGISTELATRVSEKLNSLAKKVSWASPLPEEKAKAKVPKTLRVPAYKHSVKSKARKKKK
jgi:hypothetical protein